MWELQFKWTMKGREEGEELGQFPQAMHNLSVKI